MNTRTVRTIRRQSVTGTTLRTNLDIALTDNCHSKGPGEPVLRTRSVPNFLVVGLAWFAWAFILTVAWSYQ